MNKQQLYNKLTNLKDKKIMIQIAEVVIKDNTNYISNESGFYFNLKCLKDDTINKINEIFNKPVKVVKKSNEWHEFLDRQFNENLLTNHI